MRLTDVEPLEAYDCKTDGCGYEGESFDAYVNGMQHVLEDLDSQPEIDPESLPVVKQLRAELKKMKAERDAAVNDLHKTVLDYGACNACEHQFKECVGIELCDFDGEDHWEWRGIKED